MLTLRSTILSLGLTAIALPLGGQARAPSPYRFANFIWWSDADLRAALKHRLPGLGDEIVPFSPMDEKVRLALTDLLKTKGIHAEVQSTEPGPPPPPPVDNFAGGLRAARMRLSSRLPLPPPAIVFRVLSPPDIRVSQVTIQGAPPELLSSVEQLTNHEKDSLYTSEQGWQNFQLGIYLDDYGYFLAASSILPGPYKQQDATHYLVPLTVQIDPGPRYRIGSITLDGGPLFKEDDLSRYVAAYPGGPVESGMFLRLSSKLRTAYQEAGYQYAEVDTDPILDKDHALASYNIKVDPGPQYHFRTITIKNLDAAHEQMVRDTINVKPGDEYSMFAMMRLSATLRDDSRFAGLSFSYSPHEDRPTLAVDVTLTFFKQ